MPVVTDIRKYCDYLRSRVEHRTTDRAQLLGPILNDMTRVVYLLQGSVPVHTPDLQLNDNKVQAKHLLKTYQYEVTMLRAEGWSFATTTLRRKIRRTLEIAFLAIEAMER